MHLNIYINNILDNEFGQAGIQNRIDDNRSETNILEDAILLRTHPHRTVARWTYLFILV